MYKIQRGSIYTTGILYPLLVFFCFLFRIFQQFFNRICCAGSAQTVPRIVFTRFFFYRYTCDLMYITYIYTLIHRENIVCTDSSETNR